MQPHPDHHHIRRVVLPSGKTIEVVYFEELREDASPQPREVPAPSPAPAPAAETHGTDIHHCGVCASDLVYPVDWSEVGTQHWEVELRCPNCEWTGLGVFEQEIVERFDEELERGTEVLVQDLQRLMRANMEHAIERFAHALAHDLIVPDDF